MKKLEIDFDSLIVNYMIYKAENGYDISLTYNEFMDFLKFSRVSLAVVDYESDTLSMFSNFIENKSINAWSGYESKNFHPHMDIIYDSSLKDHVLKANYRFSHYDTSVIDTYRWGDRKIKTLNDIISSYLSDKPKRKLVDNYLITDYEKDMAKRASGLIFSSIWNNYINKEIELGVWPSQCRDIDKYLFETDLASIIGTISIDDELLELYQVFSKRMAIMYHDDNNLKISSYENKYLAYSNYNLLCEGYHDLMNIGPYGKNLSIDFSDLSFTEEYYRKHDVRKDELDSDKAKKLVKNIESKI